VLATPARAHFDVALGAPPVLQFAHEARLANADIARDHDDARVASDRFVEPLVEELQLMPAAD
jgi:hypothetical protein